MKKITYSKQAIKALRNMPANNSRRVVSKIEQYAVDPATLANNIKTMQGEEFKGYYRLRIGDWRVIFRDAEVIYIFKIAPRGSIY